MNRLDRIRDVLSKLNPDHLEIIDESALHKGHREAADAEFTHVRIKISDVYQGITLLQKHRKIKALLKEELESGLHALSISFK